MNVMTEDVRGNDRDSPTAGCCESGLAGRKLLRSGDDRMVAGVCGGLGAYPGVDPVMIRLSFVTMAFAGGLAIPLYIIAWMLVPAEEHAEPTRAAPLPIPDALLVVVGGTLIAVGAALLPPQLAPWSEDRLVWIVAFLAIGTVLLLRGMRRRGVP